MPGRGSRPLGALVSQAIVAGSSLVLQLIALRQLGASGLGTFSLLLGILITVNSVQSGWLGDSLTVLDRFEPGMRRALVTSQLWIVVLVAVITTVLALAIDGIDRSTALLFGLASVMWVVEETMRRLLIARREFWKLVANDASFAVGSFGLVGYVWATGGDFTIETLVLALLGGAVVAIAVGVMQLPRVELSRGITAESRMRELSSFAVWRAAQIGLRPGSQAIVRAIVATTISLEALGQLEAARLLLAPVLTAINGAGVYLLPTYAAQARRGERFRPVVELAMMIVAGMAAGYGLITIALRTPLTDLLTDGTTVVTTAALVGWTAYAVAFGAGIPAGNAMVARGRSRNAFEIRAVDALLGVSTAGLFAVLGWVDAVPLGLAAGAFLGAFLLQQALRALPPPLPQEPAPEPPVRVAELAAPTASEVEAELAIDASARERVPAPEWQAPVGAPLPGPRPAADPQPATDAQPATDPTPVVARTTVRRERTRSDVRRPAPVFTPPARRTRVDRTSTPWQQRLVWLVPLILIVATEYKFRRRSIDDALAGSIDPMIALELGVYALVGAWVVWRLAPGRPRLTPLLVVMWAYILSTAASALYSSFAALGLARAVQLVIIGAVIHLLAVQGTMTGIGKMLHAWVVLISLSIVAGLVYVAPVSAAQVGRFTWLFVHSVSAGSMLAISLPVIFGLWLSAGRRPLPWPRWIYGAAFVVHLVALLATRTRGSIGGAVAAIALMAWLWSGTRMRPQLVLASLVGASAVALAVGDVVLEFVTRGETADQIGTFNRRTEIWGLAWDAFLQRPLQGLGFTSAKGVFFDETGLGGAHNALVNVMIDAGLVGLFWWLLMIGLTIAVIARTRPANPIEAGAEGATGTVRSDRIVLIGIVTASLVNSVTTEGLGAGVNVSAIWWFVAIAWLTILERSQRSLRRSLQNLSAEIVAELRDTVDGDEDRADRQLVGSS